MEILSLDKYITKILFKQLVLEMKAMMSEMKGVHHMKGLILQNFKFRSNALHFSEKK